MLALQAGEILYQSSILLDGKAAELAETKDLSHHAAYALARSSQLQSAILALEQSRARGLSETLERDSSNLTQLQQEQNDLYIQYWNITNQLRNLEAQQRQWLTSEDRHSLTPEDLRTTALQLRQKLNETLDQIRQVPGYEEFLAQSDFNDIVSVVQPEVPLVYLTTTSAGSFALIVHKFSPALVSPEVISIWLDKFTAADLENLVSEWRGNYGRYTEAQGLEKQAVGTKSGWIPLIKSLRLFGQE